MLGLPPTVVLAFCTFCFSSVLASPSPLFLKVGLGAFLFCSFCCTSVLYFAALFSKHLLPVFLLSFVQAEKRNILKLMRSCALWLVASQRKTITGMLKVFLQSNMPHAPLLATGGLYAPLACNRWPVALHWKSKTGILRVLSFPAMPHATCWKNASVLVCSAFLSVCLLFLFCAGLPLSLSFVPFVAPLCCTLLLLFSKHLLPVCFCRLYRQKAATS